MIEGHQRDSAMRNQWSATNFRSNHLSLICGHSHLCAYKVTISHFCGDHKWCATCDWKILFGHCGDTSGFNCYCQYHFIGAFKYNFGNMNIISGLQNFELIHNLPKFLKFPQWFKNFITVFRNILLIYFSTFERILLKTNTFL